MAKRLTGRQLAVMRVLWAHGEAKVSDVQRLLDLDPPLAYSTVATVLSRMEEKGLVTHRVVGRTFHYGAAMAEDSFGQSMVGELVERVFGGSPAELVNQLLESNQVDADELARIKALVKKHEARRRSSGKGARRGH